MSLICGEESDRLTFVPLADGTGGDWGCLASSDEAKLHLGIFLAAAALHISGKRHSYILDPSQHHPGFLWEMGGGDLPSSPHTGESVTVRPGI